ELASRAANRGRKILPQIFQVRRQIMPGFNGLTTELLQPGRRHSPLVSQFLTDRLPAQADPIFGLSCLFVQSCNFMIEHIESSLRDLDEFIPLLTQVAAYPFRCFPAYGKKFWNRG